jgi:hypothetical protein
MGSYICNDLLCVPRYHDPHNNLVQPIHSSCSLLSIPFKKSTVHAITVTAKPYYQGCNVTQVTMYLWLTLLPLILALQSALLHLNKELLQSMARHVLAWPKTATTTAKRVRFGPPKSLYSI